MKDTPQKNNMELERHTPLEKGKDLLTPSILGFSR